MLGLGLMDRREPKAASRWSPNTRVKKPRLVFAVVRYSRSCIADIDVTTPATPLEKIFFFRAVPVLFAVRRRDLSLHTAQRGGGLRSYGSTYRRRRFRSATPRVPD